MSAPCAFLLLEDARLRAALAGRFTQEGWRTVVATSLADAARRAVRDRPVLLLADTASVGEPAALAAVRSFPALLSVQIGMILSHAAPGEIAAWGQHGALHIFLLRTVTPRAIVRHCIDHL